MFTFMSLSAVQNKIHFMSFPPWGIIRTHNGLLIPVGLISSMDRALGSVKSQTAGFDSQSSLNFSGSFPTSKVVDFTEKIMFTFI